MRNKTPDIVTTLILTTITVILWVSLNIYWAVKNEPAPVVSEEISQSINPELDKNSIDEIEKRIYFEEGGV